MTEAAALQNVDTWVLIATALAIAFALIYSWVTRVAPVVEFEKYELNDIEIGYLAGGARRALEMAFFKLLRDNWISGDKNSVFVARFADAPEDLTEIEKELLKSIHESGSFTLQQLGKLDLKSLHSIDRRLVRKALILPIEKIGRIFIIPKIALGLAMGYAIKTGGEHFIRKENAFIPVICFIAIFSAWRWMERKFSHRTSAGEKLFQHKLSEIRERAQHRTETDNQGRHYDRLWSLSDEVLTKGFQSLVGGAILPTAVDDPNAPKRDAGPALSYKRDVGDQGSTEE